MKSENRADTWLAPVQAHYEQRFREAGSTARGVDWRDEESQLLRFRQFDGLCAQSSVSSVCDLGCGYGAYLSHLREQRFSGRYLGVDVAPQLLQAAARDHSRDPGAEFAQGTSPVDADAVVASGTFNVALDADRSQWESYVWEKVNEMWMSARVGIAFNLLSMISDASRRSAELYYAWPADTLRLVQAELTPHVELRHQYGLFEFTVIARRVAEVGG